MAYEGPTRWHLLSVEQIVSRVRQFGATAFRRYGDWSPERERAVEEAAAKAIAHLDTEVTHLRTFFQFEWDPSYESVSYSIEPANGAYPGRLVRTITFLTDTGCDRPQPDITYGPALSPAAAAVLLPVLNDLAMAGSKKNGSTR